MSTTPSPSAWSEPGGFKSVASEVECLPCSVAEGGEGGVPLVIMRASMTLRAAACLALAKPMVILREAIHKMLLRDGYGTARCLAAGSVFAFIIALSALRGAFLEAWRRGAKTAVNQSWHSAHNIHQPSSINEQLAATPALMDIRHLINFVRSRP